MRIETFDLAGLTWQVAPLDFDEQIKVECILLRSLGPTAGQAARIIAAGVVPLIIDLMEDAAGRGEKFDLANIAVKFAKWWGREDATSDPGLRQVWNDSLAVISETGGAAIEASLSSLSERIQPMDVIELFNLILLSRRKTQVKVSGDWFVVEDFDSLSNLLSRRPFAKWELLGRAIRVTYHRPLPEEPQGDA